MAKPITIKQFVRQLKSLPREIQQKTLQAWNRITLQTTGEAQELAPQTNQQSLTKSMNPPLRARFTDKGIKSALIARVPYAQYLEEGVDLRFKPPGEVSYYIWGKGHAGKKKGIRRGIAARKRKRGGAKFMDRAIDKNEQDFMDAVFKVIADEWSK